MSNTALEGKPSKTLRKKHVNRLLSIIDYAYEIGNDEVV